MNIEDLIVIKNGEGCSPVYPPTVRERPTFQSSKTNCGLTISWDDPQTTGATVPQLLIHQLARGYEIREHLAIKSQADDFD
jgi:hypothetical protein